MNIEKGKRYLIQYTNTISSYVGEIEVIDITKTCYKIKFYGNPSFLGSMKSFYYTKQYFETTYKIIEELENEK